MELDSLLQHYFGTPNLQLASPDQPSPQDMARGLEQLALDFGVEREPGRKFALYVLLDTLGAAPPPAEAFSLPEEADLRAAALEWQRVSSGR